LSYREAQCGGPGGWGDALLPSPPPPGGVLVLSRRMIISSGAVRWRMRALLVGYLEEGCNGVGEGEGKGASTSSASSSLQSC
jgi:hypothetical protein